MFMNTPDSISHDPNARLDPIATEDGPITESWLKSVGFKYHQLDRQPNKQWLLWMGDGLHEDYSLTSQDDIGLELAPVREGEPEWFCWFRSDSSHRYSRFIHLRRLKQRHEVIALVEAITGFAWTPANHLYGGVRKPKMADRMREEAQRLDKRMLRECGKWSEIEKDDDRGGALPEHADAYIKAR